MPSKTVLTRKPSTEHDGSNSKTERQSPLLKNKSNHSHAKSPSSVRRSAPVITKNEFKQRNSVLDVVEISKSEYRGFFNLLTIALGFFFITQQVQKILYEGTLVGLQSVYHMFSRYDLFPAWLVLVASTFSAVVFQKLIIYGLLSYNKVRTMQHSFQFVIFVASILVSLERNWPVVPTAFFLSEMLVLEMKMHSYLVSNRELQLEQIQKKKNEVEGDPIDAAIPENSKNNWPANVTWTNWVYFLLVPTLVYETEYPRTESVRVRYILTKIFAFIGLWAVLHVLVDTYIVSVLNKIHHLSLLVVISQLILPTLLSYLLIFYIVFDVICGGCAELTRFADREFYLDWWNSTSFDEFARKWNRPVHEWLLRHVYLEGINTYKMSKKSATFSHIFVLFYNS